MNTDNKSLMTIQPQRVDSKLVLETAYRFTVQENPAKERGIPSALFVFFFILYAYSRANTWALPTIFSIDGAELTLNSIELGVDHPPGHPLWTLLAHLFYKLKSYPAEWGAIHASILPAALFVPYLYRTLGLLTQNRLSYFLLSFSFGTSFLFWLHGSIMEVYALQSLCLILVFFYSLKSISFFEPFDFIKTGLSLGLLGSVNYPYIIALTPYLVMLYYPFLKHREIRIKQLVYVLLSTFIGLLPLLYIPLRLKSGNFIFDLNYLSGYKLGSFKWYIWYLSGWGFTLDRGGWLSTDISQYFRFLLKYIQSVLENFTPFSLFLLPFSFYFFTAFWKGYKERLAKKDISSLNWVYLLVFLQFLIYAIPSIAYSVADQEVFFFPSFICLSLFLSSGFQLIEKKRKGFILFSSAFLLSIIISSIYSGKKVLSISKSENEYKARLAMIQGFPLGSLILGHGDGTTLRYKYFQSIKSLRPDLEIDTINSYLRQYRGEFSEEIKKRFDTNSLYTGLLHSDKFLFIKKVLEKNTERDVFLIQGKKAIKYPGIQYQPVPYNPEVYLISLTSAGSSHNEKPLMDINLNINSFPAHLKLEGYSFKTDKENADRIKIDKENSKIHIPRNLEFQFLLSVKRLNQTEEEYIADIFFTDREGNIIEDKASNFYPAFRFFILHKDTKKDEYETSSFYFSFPEKYKAGIYRLFLRLNQTTGEIQNLPGNRKIHKTEIQFTSPVKEGDKPGEFIPLGNVEIY